MNVPHLLPALPPSSLYQEMSHIPQDLCDAATAPLNFPQELIELIIQYLEGDLAALAGVSLVERGWYFSTRVGLFGDIRIGGPKALSRSEQLLELSKLNPSLLRRTRTLTLEEDADYIFDQKPWLAYCPFIAKILPLFESISRLNIHASHQHTIDMGALPVDTSRALSNLIACPSVVHLSLARVKRFNLAPSLFHHLQTLNMEALDPEREPAEESQDTGGVPQQRVKSRSSVLYTSTAPLPAIPQGNPRSLRIRDCGDALQSLLAFNRSHPSSAFRPTELVVATGGCSLMREGMSFLLDTYGPGLTSLKIFDRLGSSEDDDILRGVQFSNLPHLEHLSFSILTLFLFHHWIQHHHGPVLTLFEMLENLSVSPSAARLASFSIDIAYCLCDDDRHLGKYALTWAHLDTVLSRDAFSGLAKVSFVFDFQQESGVSFERMRELENNFREGVTQAMPNLGPSGSGILEVIVQDAIQ